MSLAGEREFTAIDNLANSDHISGPRSKNTNSLDPPIRFGRSIVEKTGNGIVMLNSQKPQQFSSLSNFQNSKIKISAVRNFEKSHIQNTTFDDVIARDG